MEILEASHCLLLCPLSLLTAVFLFSLSAALREGVLGSVSLYR